MQVKNKFIRLVLATFLSASIVALPAGAQTKAVNGTTVPYTWKSVQMVGGGFVDGIVFHPKAKGVRYCRTDMGGAYRWNEATKKWEPILDFVPYKDLNLMGVESIALDPADPNFVALACGTYARPGSGSNAILRSFDKGKTFERTDVPFRFGGNENGRGNGERMAVDPKNSNILYIGTRLNGLWKSTDRAKTWTQVTSFPDMTEAPPQLPAGADSIQRRRAQFGARGAGVVVTLFDAGNAANGFSIVYAFASLMGKENIFRSVDNGATWQAVPGQPTAFRPTHAVLAKDGMLYITYSDNPGPSGSGIGAVWKYSTTNNVWTDITPDKPDATRRFGYAAVSVDAQHPQTVIVSSYNRYSAGGEEIFRTLDGGATWKPVFKTGKKFDDKLAPYVEQTGIHWLFDIEIDPFDSNHAMFTTGYGGHETFDLGDVDKDQPTIWSVMSTGIEETVALELASPPKGAALLTAVGDYGGFVHWNLDKPAPEGNYDHPHFNNTDGVAYGEANPDVIVRVGIASHPSALEKNIGYSLDAGRTWQPPATIPQAASQHGQIAVSADGKTWIWTPQRSPAFVTHDNGATWQQCTGIADNLKVIADKVNPKKFYALAFMQGKLYTSADGGATFTEQALSSNIAIPQQRGDRGDNRGGQDRIYATPGIEGDLWISDFDGLYHSTNGGKTFAKNSSNSEEIHAFGFGKGAPGSAYAALYVVGTVNGVRGFFRSDDKGQKWTRINDDMHQYGLVLHITGDPKKWGRVYVGTHGRGVLYGDPK